MSDSFRIAGKDDDFLIYPPNVHSPGVDAFFTTKKVNDDIASVSLITGIPVERIYLPIQRHTGTVHILKDDLTPVVSDAVVTDARFVVIGVRVADCVPVLLYDRTREVIGAVHAGWKGTAQGILKNTITLLSREFGTKPGDVQVAIGPCIRGSCYNVGGDVLTVLLNSVKDREGDFYGPTGRFVDLTTLNCEHALSAGVSKQNIWQYRACSHCNPDKFFSYRYSGKVAGRQGGFIVMR